MKARPTRWRSPEKNKKQYKRRELQRNVKQQRARDKERTAKKTRKTVIHKGRN